MSVRWSVYGEAVIGEVEAPDKRLAEAAAREQYGERFGRVQSRISVQLGTEEMAHRAPVKRRTVRAAHAARGRVARSGR
jgi:hypothetical protein